MLVFDEKKYAEDIIKNKKYNTIKSQGRERCIIARYLKHIGKDDEYIKNILHNIPMSGGEFLSYKEKDIIFNKILKKANEFDFIYDISINIYKSEIDVILSIDDINVRHLLFCLLVYYKWALNVRHLKFYSKKKNCFMVTENNMDMWKISNLSSLRVMKRFEILNYLFLNKLYVVENFKSNNYINIPFCTNEGEIFLTINNFDNVLGEILLIEFPEKYKRCCICDTVITKTRSPKKYCSICAKKENIRKTKENRKNLKSKT